MARITFDLTSDILADRVHRMQSRLPPEKLKGMYATIHFLRSMESRSTFALASFYALLAADVYGKNRCILEGDPGRVFQSQWSFVSLNAVGMICRMTFDHDHTVMSGANFFKVAQVEGVMAAHAKYWANGKSEVEADALRALSFLRAFFKKFSKRNDELFKSGSTLGNRIGLLKRYADQSAAHLSLNDYEFDRMDVAHVVAALVIVAAMVHSFDASAADGYFNQIDSAAYSAAMQLFPDAKMRRLLDGVDIDELARLCWQQDEVQGLELLSGDILRVISWS
ncbi:hypothetical protein [Pseudoxanthomonas suwonensis]|uniref:hypothetical protein n=1 Tax=Pseudoxanthomonas suwonensis TaxID=314722 RepID=UPI000463AD84|nr:hypothetical protein [Pseudoxanthomonas suwonensis]